MIQATFINLISKYSDADSYNLKYWNEIESCYTAKSRYYHDLTHIENMLLELDFVRSNIKDIDTILFSIFYHDIIYKATKGDNEHQSALLFKKRISQTTFSHISDSFAQIEATKSHLLSTSSDTNYLLDIDLSILGTDTETYQIYVTNIRKEYQIYPDFLYKKGRKKVLEHILRLPSIYKTDYFIHKYEKQARVNLQFELLSNS